ncbi:cellulose biosynthesis protein BcsE [Erwinia pyrifoliae]|uniref:cellulose biosynthesis protein BcsE n=1 Tax=Erwinia pyrifoliae TaxID=79967 RepID=UPI00223BCEBA|nr:cellulose biosynthesis protein BcsE [Erwinia pyrifoliae]MCT2385513.1 cellulose biosynthesis protein BcsE [Erwinia pyrifoliae]MCU8588914.1 cellulose biosynthesis protein BcsE [Erwinia pyrifoliae]
MTTSFTLGLEQVQNELVLMKAPGCYWVMVDRQQDARLLVRQTLAAHTAITLISRAAGANEDLLPPVDAGACDRISLFSLSEAPDALTDLTQYLSRRPDDNPGLILFCAALSTWNNLSGDELTQWLQEMQQRLARKQLTLLVITEGGGVDVAQHHLHACYRHLAGLSHLSWQQGSWHYRVHWWCHSGRWLADRLLSLDVQQGVFTQIAPAQQDARSEWHDENLYLVEKNVLGGAPLPTVAWTLFEDNGQLTQRAQQASSATVVFNLQHHHQIETLAGDIHQLRRTRGSRLKIAVREMQQALRHSDERLLLACGVNTIVPLNVPTSRCLAALEGVQGQVYNRHVPAEFAVLLKSMQPVQDKGYLPLTQFCHAVTRMINNRLLPENGKGLLVALSPVATLSAQQALMLCRPRRFGDLVTHTADCLYLFLSFCHHSHLETALKFIFPRPAGEIFIVRQVWFEDLLVCAALQHIACRGADPVSARPSAPLSGL